MSLRAFSIECHVHYSTLSKMESHQKIVAPKTALQVCEALHKDINDLFEIQTTEAVNGKGE